MATLPPTAGLSAFLTPLHLEPIGPDRWRLVAPLVYASALLDGQVTIPEGWETDLESLPRWLPALYALLYGSAHEASVIHDWACTYAAFCVVTPHGITHRVPVSRAEADGLIYEAMRTPHRPRPENQAAAWKASTVWAGVRAAGWVSWARHRQRGLRLPWACGCWAPPVIEEA